MALAPDETISVSKCPNDHSNMSKKSQPPDCPITSSTPLIKKRRKKKKRPPHKSKMITGYIIYASEIRKDVIKKYPDRDFGHISKLVGIEWKNLPQETKVAYEKRAQEQNAISKAIAAEASELKKLADAAEDKAKEQLAKANLSNSQQLPNGFTQYGYSQPTATMIHNNGNHISQPQQQQFQNWSSQSPMLSTSQNHVQTLQFHQTHQSHPSQHQSPIKITTIQQQQLQQQPPLQIIQQQQQPVPTTVQYCNNSVNGIEQPPHLQPQQSYESSHSPPVHGQVHRNTIVYRKPTTVRLKPKDSTTQTDAIEWIDNLPKKPLRFSEKFIEYLHKSLSD